MYHSLAVDLEPTMAFKFIVFAACLAAASAGHLHSAPLAYASYSAPVIADYHHEPQYAFGYGVMDAYTGDNKHHEESRHGDIVKGSYSLQESDGTRRVVHYTADSVNGFNAVVDKEPSSVAVKTVSAPIVSAPVVTKVAAPIVSAPVVTKVATPIIAKYAAPVAYSSYAAPVVAKYAAPVAYTSYAAPAATYATSYAAPATYAATYAAPTAYAHSAAYTAPATYATYAAPSATYATYGAPVTAKIAAPAVFSSYSAPVAYNGYASSYHGYNY